MCLNFITKYGQKMNPFLIDFEFLISFRANYKGIDEVIMFIKSEIWRKNNSLYKKIKMLHIGYQILDSSCEAMGTQNFSEVFSQAEAFSWDGINK